MKKSGILLTIVSMKIHRPTRTLKSKSNKRDGNPSKPLKISILDTRRGKVLSEILSKSLTARQRAASLTLEMENDHLLFLRKNGKVVERFNNHLDLQQIVAIQETANYYIEGNGIEFVEVK